MIIKRIISSTIDLSFGLIPVLIAFYSKNIWEYYFFISFVIYLFHTNISLIMQPYNTIGEKLAKISVVYASNKILIKSLLRNLLFSILIFGPLIISDNIFELSYYMIGSLFLVIPFHDRRNKKKLINGLDILFKPEYQAKKIDQR